MPVGVVVIVHRCHRIWSAVVIAGQLISAGAVSPVVIRAGHRAQVVVGGQDELSRLVDGQLWMVLRQARGHLRTQGVLIPEFPAHVVAVCQHRRIRSGDAHRPYGGQEVRDGGASRRGQGYGDDGSSGTDEDFSDRVHRPPAFYPSTSSVEAISQMAVDGELHRLNFRLTHTKRQHKQRTTARCDPQWATQIMKRSSTLHRRLRAARNRSPLSYAKLLVQ
jgi:hypothetical protein